MQNKSNDTKPRYKQILRSILNLAGLEKYLNSTLPTAHWASNPQILLARGTFLLAKVFKLINN